MGFSIKDVNVETPPKDIAEGVTKEIGGDARQATEIEHQMTFFEAVKLYPGAVGWSIFFSLGIIMTAFDPQLLGNLYATPAFQKDFGYLFEGTISSVQLGRLGWVWETQLGNVWELLARRIQWNGLAGRRHLLPVLPLQQGVSSSNSSHDRSTSYLQANSLVASSSVPMQQSLQLTHLKSARSPFVAS